MDFGFWEHTPGATGGTVHRPTQTAASECVGLPTLSVAIGKRAYACPFRRVHGL